RLNTGGVMCQWIHLYQISARDVLIFLKTFHAAFPHLSVWIDDSDMLVLGSVGPINIDAAKIEQALAEPDVEKNLERSNINASNLLQRYVGDERLAEVLEKSLPENTDDRPILEFSAPRS